MNVMLGVDDIRTLVALFCGGTLLTFLCIGWKNIWPINKASVITFLVMVMGSSLARLFIYRPGKQPAPGWYLVFVDVTLIAVCICFILSIWMRIHHRT